MPTVAHPHPRSLVPVRRAAGPRLGTALLACCLLTEGPSSAEEPAAAPQAPTGGEAAALAPPALEFAVTHQGPTVRWQVEVKNAGSQPVLLVADPRLLWFEVKVPGKQKPAICRLPTEVFPNRPDPETELLLRPGESATQRFDPRLYCFGESGQTELVPGSQIAPRFGWPEERKARWVNGKRLEEVVDHPPHVARTLDPAAAEAIAKGGKPPPETPQDLQVKVLSGDGFALGSEYAAWSRARLPSATTPLGPLRLTLKQGSDAEAERLATVQLELRNQGTAAAYVYFRRELVSFDVAGPTGLTDCDPEPDLRSPDRSAFQRLAPGERVTVNNRLVELCPRGTFGMPGLYLVHARFDSSQDGAEYELDAFVGRVSTEQPVGVRIRKGDKPAPRRMDHTVPTP